VVADGARQQHRIGRASAPSIDARRHDADAGGAMNTPSPLPRSTTLVSPVTIGTPPRAPRRHRFDDALEVRQREALFEDEAGGQQRPRAHIATSLTVPCTDRQPMSPPGKNSGETTCASVAITTRSPGAGRRRAPSLPCRSHCCRRRREQLAISCRAAAGAVGHVDRPSRN
jgi:hypothetical protein